jgi:hypothetical protein
MILMLLTLTAAAALLIGASAIVERRRVLDDDAMGQRAIGLPPPYDVMALREMRTTRAAGVRLTGRLADDIVKRVGTLARERGIERGTGGH